jgi:hypothetical protein
MLHSDRSRPVPTQTLFIFSVTTPNNTRCTQQGLSFFFPANFTSRITPITKKNPAKNPIDSLICAFEKFIRISIATEETIRSIETIIVIFFVIIFEIYGMFILLFVGMKRGSIDVYA